MRFSKMSMALAATFAIDTLAAPTGFSLEVRKRAPVPALKAPETFAPLISRRGSNDRGNGRGRFDDRRRNNNDDVVVVQVNQQEIQQVIFEDDQAVLVQQKIQQVIIANEDIDFDRDNRRRDEYRRENGFDNDAVIVVVQEIQVLNIDGQDALQLFAQSAIFDGEGRSNTDTVIVTASDTMTVDAQATDGLVIPTPNAVAVDPALVTDPAAAALVTDPAALEATAVAPEVALNTDPAAVVAEPAVSDAELAAPIESIPEGIDQNAQIQLLEQSERHYSRNQFDFNNNNDFNNDFNDEDFNFNDNDFNNDDDVVVIQAKVVQVVAVAFDGGRNDYNGVDAFDLLGNEDFDDIFGDNDRDDRGRGRGRGDRDDDEDIPDDIEDVLDFLGGLAKRAFSA